MEKIKQIEKLLLDLAMIYRDEKVTRQHIRLWATILNDFSIEEIQKCAYAYIKDPENTWFPIPITKLMTYLEESVDPKDEAKLIADRVICAVSKYGYTNGNQAREYIGDIGWEAVTEKYYWAYLCENLNSTLDEGTYYAQLRDSITAKLRKTKREMLRGDLQQISAKMEIQNLPKEISKAK